MVVPSRRGLISRVTWLRRGCDPGRPTLGTVDDVVTACRSHSAMGTTVGSVTFVCEAGLPLWGRGRCWVAAAFSRPRDLMEEFEGSR